MAYIQDVQESVPALPEAGNLTSFVVLSQNENGRRLNFKIVGVDIPSGSTATFSGTKPDGVVYSTTGTISGNIVTVNEDIQMTAVAGSWDAKIRVLNGGNVIASAKVRMTIDADPVDPDAIPSDSQLDGIVAECQAYAESARSDAYGSPLTASTAAGMIDKTRVYVYTGSETGYTNGHWYYWDGTAWADGGTYNSSGIQTDTTLSVPGMAADAKAAGDEISDLKEDLGDLSELETTVKTDLVSAINEANQHGGGGSGLTEDMKQALLACFENVAWIGDDGQDYYDALEEALYPPANLTRITAVYTQSGTVTNWNTLNDLKTDLVVTAYYDNGTTATVSNYALTGTLVAPSSTITVTYGGKSATFSVTVTESDVPSGYTAYDYIEMTDVPTSGNAARYYSILTDMQLHSDYIFEIELGFGNNRVSDSGFDPAFGTRQGGSGSGEFMLYFKSNTGELYPFFDGTGQKPSQPRLTTSANTLSKYKYLPVGKSETYPNNNVIEVDGVQWNTGQSVTGKSFAPWFGFFGYATSSGGYSSSAIYYRGYVIGKTTITDSDDNVIYKFIPARNSDGIYGFYEAVHNRFYYNNYNDGALLSHYTGGNLEAS